MKDDRDVTFNNVVYLYYWAAVLLYGMHFEQNVLYAVILSLFGWVCFLIVASCFFSSNPFEE